MPKKFLWPLHKTHYSRKLKITYMIEDTNNDKITVKMLGDTLVDFIKKNPANGVIYFNSYVLTNYDKLTTEAQKKVDELQEIMVKHMDDFASKLPESLDKRKLMRLSRGAKGRRLFAKSYVKNLEDPIKSPPKLHLKVGDLFIEHLQIIMDFYQDILENGTMKGVDTFCKLSLLAVSIDELLVAFHLSQRNFGGQALSHIRTIYEALDLVDLFNREPKWTELWTSGKPWQEVWNELSPGKVRSKLGKDNVFKEIYSLMSVLGAHPSFEMMRARCNKAAKPSEDGNPKILVKIGVSPSSKEAIFAHFFLLLSVIMVMATEIMSFGNRLNSKESESAMLKCCMDYADLYDNYLVKPIKESGGKVDGTARELMENLTKTLFKKT